MAWGLDTDTFLNAFTRCTSRRGVPKEVTSDRGTVGGCSRRVKETSQPVRPTTLSEQDSGTWTDMEIQSTRCLTFWRSPWSNGESCQESHLCRCRRTRCKRWGADHCVSWGWNPFLIPVRWLIRVQIHETMFHWLLIISCTAKWGNSSRLSLLKPLLCIRVNDGERSRTLFHECGGDGSRNVFVPLTADQSGLQNSET